MKRAIAVVVLCAFASTSVVAVGGKKAQYMGGTIAGLPENAEGRLDSSGAEHLIFTPDKKDFNVVQIPYAAVTELEYGQKAGRRVGAAVGTSLLLGPIGLVTLFSKKRKHYLTISYTDQAGKEQAGVFELGKDIIRTTLTVLETRTGKEIVYQDDEARKHSRGGN